MERIALKAENVEQGGCACSGAPRGGRRRGGGGPHHDVLPQVEGPDAVRVEAAPGAVLRRPEAPLAAGARQGRACAERAAQQRSPGPLRPPPETGSPPQGCTRTPACPDSARATRVRRAGLDGFQEQEPTPDVPAFGAGQERRRQGRTMLVSERGVPAAHVLQGRAGGVRLLPGRSHVHGLRREPRRS